MNSSYNPRSHWTNVMDRVILASYFQEQARLHAGIPKSKITENSKNMLTAAAARQLTNYRQQAMIWIDDEIRAAAYKGKTNTYIEIVLPNSGMHEWIYNNLIEVKTSLQGREFIVNTAVRSLPATLQMSIYW